MNSVLHQIIKKKKKEKKEKEKYNGDDDDDYTGTWNQALFFFLYTDRSTYLSILFTLFFIRSKVYKQS